MAPYLTSVFSHLCISTIRKALAMASFVSSSANRIPIQFLRPQQRCQQSSFALSCSPRSIAKRKIGHRMSFGFFSWQKPVLNTRWHESRASMLRRPLWNEFLRIRPNSRIVVDRIHGNGDNWTLRYSIASQLIISRCHPVVSVRCADPVQRIHHVFPWRTSWRADRYVTFRWSPYPSNAVRWVSQRWLRPR